MENKHLIIEDLESLRPLTSEEVTSLQGALSIAYPWPEGPDLPDHPAPEDKPHFPRPKFPDHPYPRPYPLPYPKPYPIPCSHYPTKGGHLPWCAVIL